MADLNKCSCRPLAMVWEQVLIINTFSLSFFGKAQPLSSLFLVDNQLKQEMNEAYLVGNEI